MRLKLLFVNFFRSLQRMDSNPRTYVSSTTAFNQPSLKFAGGPKIIIICFVLKFLFSDDDRWRWWQQDLTFQRLNKGPSVSFKS